MPPRAVRKVTAKKGAKPAARSKSLQSDVKEEVVAIAEVPPPSSEKNPEADSVPAIDVKEEPVVEESVALPAAAVEEEKTPKLEGKVAGEAVGEKVEEETAAEVEAVDKVEKEAEKAAEVEAVDKVEKEVEKVVGVQDALDNPVEMVEVGKVVEEIALENVDDTLKNPEEAEEPSIEADEAEEPFIEADEAEEPSIEADKVDDGANMINVEKGAEVVEAEAVESEVEAANEGGVETANEEGDAFAQKDEGADGLNDFDNSESCDDGEDEENDEEDPSLYLSATMSERKQKKEFEIFIGGLNKEAAEEDLIEVFGVYGEVQSVRIVRNPSTQRSKGFAFIRYTSVEHAKKALAELKDGTEVRGKRVGISASHDNDTLYLGNVCKTWTKDHVLETLKGLGIEQVEHLLLPDDPKNEGKIKGFAFLEFNSHSDAMAAFQRLKKPDAVFGCDRSAKVAFAQTPMHPTEEVLSQVKTVYVKGIPTSWDEEKIKELCKQYGEVEKVQLFQKSKTSKKKDFGFVDFTSRESAVACVKGINNVQLGEGEVKVEANLAKPKPLNKGRLAKQGARGGFKVEKNKTVTEEAGQPKKKKHAKAKEVPVKGETQRKLKNVEGSKPSKFQGKVTKDKQGPQKGRFVKGKKRGGRGMDTAIHERPSKKARKNHNYGNLHGRPSEGFGNQRYSYSGQPIVNHVVQPTSYAPRYIHSASSYQAYSYAGSSGSIVHHSDLEPHAGYVPAAKPIQYSYGYEQRRTGAYDSQARSGSDFAGGAPVTQTSYHGYSGYAGYEAGYAYPGSGAYLGSSANASHRTYY